MRITINCEKALIALKNNKEDHLKDYAEQMKVYEQELQTYFKKQAEYQHLLNDWELSSLQIKNKEMPVKDFYKPSKPNNYEGSYDFYIGVFTAHIFPSMELSEEEFQAVVLNKFSWRDQFYNYTPSKEPIGYSGSTGDTGYTGSMGIISSEEKIKQVQTKSISYFVEK